MSARSPAGTPAATNGVLPHGPIERLEENLWRVVGDLPGAPPLKRAMTIARTRDGRLVLYSAIALDDARTKELESLGTPAFLVVPNDRHRLDARACKARWPAMRVIAPEGARKKIEEVIAVDDTSPTFDHSIAWSIVDGTNAGEGGLVVRSKRGVTIVLCDAIMNNRKFPGFKGFFLNLFGFSGPGPKVTFATKKVLVKDRAAFRSGVERLAATPDLVRVLVAHGAPIDDAPADVLHAIAGAL